MIEETYFVCQINTAPANTGPAGEGKTNIFVPQKPDASLFFTGRKAVLEQLGKIFFQSDTSSLMLRRSCLLWGLGGIGKTQICLKFIEKMSDRWVITIHE